MRLYYSKVLDRLIQAPGILEPITEMTLKRGVNYYLELQYLDEDLADTPVRLADGAVPNFGIKLPGHYEDDYFARATGLATSGGAWTRPGSDAGFYTATINCNTDELNAQLLTPDDNLTNDISSAEFMLVCSYRLVGEDNPHVADEIAVTVVNTGDTGDEGDPVPADPSLAADIAALKQNAFQFLPLVTGYTGGGSTNLDGVITDGIAVGIIRAFRHATDGLRIYLLRAGTNAEASPGIIRPDDYDGTTNAKVWQSFL